jgi:hypothetical protein
MIGDSGYAIPHLITRTLASSTYKENPTAWNKSSCSLPLLDPSGKVNSTVADLLLLWSSRLCYEKSPGSWTVGGLVTLGTALPGCTLRKHDQKMEGGGSGPQATASAPQLHSPPNCWGVRNFPGPMMPHHVGPYSCRLFLPPASKRIHPDHPAQGAAQTHCPSPKGTSHSGTRGLPIGTPSPSGWGNHKPGQPKEWSKGRQGISHTIGGHDHMPVQVAGKIGGRHP